MRIAAALLLLVTLGLLDAAACPPGPCNKYRQFPVVEVQPMLYRRAVRETPPARFDRRALARFLTAAAWIPDTSTPQPGTIPARTVRFVSADRIERTTDRAVIVRQLERRNGTTYVEIDGVFFSLSQCRDGRRASSCLTRVGALPEPEVTTKTHKFATPP